MPSLFHLSSMNHRLFLHRTCVAIVLLACALPSQAQLLPQGLITAPSADAALTAIGAVKAEPSGYLSIQAPDVALPGCVTATVESKLPGTVSLVFVRGTAAAAKDAQGQGAMSDPAAIPVRPPTEVPVLVTAELVVAGRPAKLQTTFPVTTTEAFTLLAFAQGRWFSAVREIKVGKPPSSQHRNKPNLTAGKKLECGKRTVSP